MQKVAPPPAPFCRCRAEFLALKVRNLRSAPLICLIFYNFYISDITNGIPEVQKPRIKDSGVSEFFSGIFLSEDIGYAKPDERFFEECFKRIDGFQKEESIIVGDSLSSDIQGGINAGILTCHFNPKSNPYNKIKPDYKISDLSELIPLLDSIK